MKKKPIKTIRKIKEANMFLSIILPIYNVEKYLEECLQSCLNQDISPTDYEIICVNDGSKDNCLKILKIYEKKYSNIVIVDKSNRGVSAARNEGLKIAKGEYIWFIDPDDFIAPNILKQLKEVSQKSKADRIKIESYSFFNELSFEEKKMLIENSLKTNAPYKRMFVTRTLYKRSYLEKNEILFLVGVAYGEDGLFNYQTEIYNPLTVESNVLAYFYRLHNLSATGLGDKTVISKKFLAGSNLVTNVIVENYNKKIGGDATRWMVVYWMRAVMEKYSFMDADYFLKNFAWNYVLKDVPVTDFELRKLDAIMHNLSKTHNYKKLVSVVNRYNRKVEFLKVAKRKKKKLIGYIKHPRRLLNEMLLFFKK